MTLVHLEQPLDALHHLELALRWGTAPFEPRIYEQLLTNKKLLRGQLGRIAVACVTEQADVTLDGEPLLDCPDSHERWVTPGGISSSPARPVTSPTPSASTPCPAVSCASRSPSFLSGR